MSKDFDRNRRKRIVIGTPSARHSRGSRRMIRPTDSPKSEALVAVSVIGAAALATFLALFITSRPYDPTSSSLAPQQDVPPSALSLQPSPKPTPSAQPSVSPTPASAAPAHPLGETNAPLLPDDAAVQREIERKLAQDTTLAGIDVSVIVEGGKVTLVGSVRSQDLKNRVERVVRFVKGVSSVDNQLIVSPDLS